MEAPPRRDAAAAHDRAQRADDPALSPDPLADVCFGNVEPEEKGTVLLRDLLDPHGRRLVDEPACEFGDQLRHRFLLDAASLEEPRHRTRRLRALLEPAAHLLLV